MIPKNPFLEGIFFAHPAREDAFQVGFRNGFDEEKCFGLREVLK